MKCEITGLQDYRELIKSSSLTPLLKQGQQQQVAQDYAQMALDYLQGWRLQNFYQPILLFDDPYRKKNCFLMFRQNVPFSGCAHCLFSGHWALLRRAWLPSPNFLPSGIFIYVDKSPLKLLLSRLISPSSQILSPYEKCSSPVIISVVFHWVFSSNSHSHWLARLPARDRNSTPWIARLLNGLIFSHSHRREVLKSG